MNQSKTIGVHELAHRDAEGKVDLIDVRSPMEFQEVRAVTARNIPLDKHDPHSVMNHRDGAAD